AFGGASCRDASSSGSPSGTAGNALDTLLQGTLAAGSGKTAGSIDVKAGPGTVAGSWSGDRSGQGSVTLKIPVQQKTIDAQLLWVNNTLYIQRSPEQLTNAAQLGMLVRPADAAPWRSTPFQGRLGPLVPSAFSPTALLQWLKQFDVRLEPATT